MPSFHKLVVLITGFVFAAAIFAGAFESRTLKKSIDTEGIQKLSMDVGVGDVTILSETDLQQIALKIVLHPRRGGFFSGLAQGEKQVKAAELKIERSGTELSLEVESTGGDRRFEEDWEIHIPRSLKVELELGVGDLEFKNSSQDAEIEVGVGDIRVSHDEGNLNCEVGVGDIRVQASAEKIKAISASTGVGDVLILKGKSRIKGEGMVSNDLDWKGEGKAAFDLENGVGDIRITLDDHPSRCASVPAEDESPANRK